MESTLKILQQAVGTEKLTVLAAAIDTLMAMHAETQRGFSLEEQSATLEVEELASQYGVSFETMRNQLREVLGDAAVFRLGKKWVIRQVKFLDYLRARETKSEGEK